MLTTVARNRAHASRGACRGLSVRRG